MTHHKHQQGQRQKVDAWQLRLWLGASRGRIAHTGLLNLMTCSLSCCSYCWRWCWPWCCCRSGRSGSWRRAAWQKTWRLWWRGWGWCWCWWWVWGPATRLHHACQRDHGAQHEGEVARGVRAQVGRDAGLRRRLMVARSFAACRLGGGRKQGQVEQLCCEVPLSVWLCPILNRKTSSSPAPHAATSTLASAHPGSCSHTTFSCISHKRACI